MSGIYQIKGVGAIFQKHQIESIEYACEHRKCFLADEMGLGK